MSSIRIGIDLMSPKSVAYPATTSFQARLPTIDVLVLGSDNRRFSRYAQTAFRRSLWIQDPLAIRRLHMFLALRDIQFVLQLPFALGCKLLVDRKSVV